MPYSSWSQAVRCSLAFCLALGAWVLPVGAQRYTGSMAGMVADPSGAVVAANMDKAATTAANFRTIVIDAAPTHVANTFSPIRSLGAAIDRLKTGAPDHLLNDPLLTEILGAGWQTVTYRQNTELMVEAWHWNPQGVWSDKEKQQGYFVGTAEPAAELIRHSWAAASRLQSGRRKRLVAAHRWRSEVLLEEQSVSHQGLHWRGRLTASAMGDDRSGEQKPR